MKKEERKKQLHGRILCATVLIGINLFWVILLSKQCYEVYVSDYIEKWQVLKIHRKVIVLPEDACKVTIQTESGEVYVEYE